ncbi:MAG: AAA family ATPase [Rhodospirillaceae bacterium]|jgi:replicative DNA helicase|nr:AAA family ATPase [Rhodospirillaceae bacterium]MBT4686892.1 AAA family ATPase [Rhodospirillaceae bacterium]MBT5081862.1 AAA family ATPase [Rhodospirillaceae bacterium]MBT5524900.1 AAA family ATPase [Rhodospirillaceae bacterium]MBT6912179.1 AAA family ATPase [Rhodospirillaceae bacterium]
MNEPVNPQADGHAMAGANAVENTESELGAIDRAKGPVAAAEYLPLLQSQYGNESAGQKVIPAAFQFLNNSMGGWRTGLHLLAGEPGSGKSSFALLNAAVAAQAGFPVLYMSFDVQAEFLVLKMLCQQAGLNSRDMLDGTLNEGVLSAAIAAQEETFSRIEVIEADPELPNESAVEMARQLIAESERDRALVIIDYLQIWAAGSRQFTEFRHEIAKLMTAMRHLALDLDSPVLAISSQNRMHQGEALLQSLEGTSDLEYSADSITFLVNVERPASQGSYTNPDDLITKSRSLSVNLRKNRFGETGSRMVKFLPATGAFDEETVRRPYPR